MEWHKNAGWDIAIQLTLIYSGENNDTGDLTGTVEHPPKALETTTHLSIAYITFPPNLTRLFTVGTEAWTEINNSITLH